MMVLLFWFFGLLLGLTPCAIPLILIMTSLYGESSKSFTKAKALILAVLFTCSLALTYAILGVLVAALGLHLKPYTQDIGVLGALSAIFFVLGLSTLGLFNLQLPKQWLHAISTHNTFRKFGPWIEAMVLGILATLIAAPCVIAPLFGVLTYIANMGDIKLGGIALFFTGVGFGTPLLAISLFGSGLIQQAGKWQKHIRQFFGLLLMAIAIWLLGSLIPAKWAMLLWGALAIFVAIYMGALIKDEKNSALEGSEDHVVCSLDGEEVPQKSLQKKNMGAITKMISLMILIYGFILLVGALLGNENPFSPLTHKARSQDTNARVDINHHLGG